MRDDQQGAGPRVQQILHRGQHVGVEIVGGLVEHQHVGLVEQDQQQLQAPLLAAGQIADRRGHLGVGEAEPLQQLGRGHLLAAGHVGGALAADHVADPVRADVLELVELLGQRHDLDGLALLDPPRRRFDGARDQTEQGRLARSVGAEDAGALAGTDPPLDVLEHGLVVRHGHVEDVDDVLAEPRGRHLLQLDGVADRRFVLDQRVGRVDAELGLGGAGRALRGAATPAPCASGSDAWTPSPRCAGRARRAAGCRPRSRPRRARRCRRAPPTWRCRPRRGTTGRASRPAGRRRWSAQRVFRCPASQVMPSTSRWLVGSSRNSTSWSSTSSAASATRRRCPPDRVPMTASQLMSETSPAMTSRMRGVAGPLVLVAVADDGQADGPRLVEGVGLVEHGDVDAAAGRDAPGVGLEEAGEDAQERRLAVAVATDDADAIAFVDADRHRSEDGLGREVQRDLFNAEKMGHWVSLGTVERQREGA